MQDLVFIDNKQPVTSSRKVAENFGKEHRHVLESIRDILAAENSAAKFFHETTYENRGKQYPEYLMNRDGFSLLVMGFTGKAALEWKLKYIDAFNKMEQALKNGEELPKAGEVSKLDIQRQRVEVSKLNARTRNAKLLADLAKTTGSDSYREVLIAYAANTAAGEKILELPEGDGRERHGLGWYAVHCLNRKDSWRSQLGKVLTQNGIEKINKKTGVWVEDKAANNNTQRQNFEWYVDYLVPVIEDFIEKGILTKAVPLQDVLDESRGKGDAEK